MKQLLKFKEMKFIIVILISLLLPVNFVSGQTKVTKAKIGQYFPNIIPTGIPMGANNGEPGPGYGFGNYVFTNMFLLARYTDINGNPIDFNDSTFTSDFWPVTDFYIQLPNTKGAGTYYVQIQGSATIEVIQPANTVKVAQSFNGATQTTTAWFNVTDTQSTFRMAFIHVGSAVVKNIVVYSPQYLTGTGANAKPIANIRPFENEVYAALATYPSVSFYNCTDWGFSDNGEQNWSDRSLPGRVQASRLPLYLDREFPGFYQANEPTHRGMSYEYMLDYANRTNKDIYIYIPVQATR